MRLSVIVPVYNSEATITRLVDALRNSLADRCDLEIVLVNDGSRDRSGEICRALALRHAELRFLDLSRNFGEHNAVMAGLAHCSGECAVIIDDDFQNPPGEIVRLVDDLVRGGHDVVFSRYEKKQHHPLRNLGSWFHNRVASLLLDKPPDLYLSSFKAMNRFLIDEVTRYQGPYPYIDGLILRVTRNYGTVLVEHAAREEGESSYTLRKLVGLWLNMVTNFSILPLRVASLAGIGVSLVGVLVALLFVIERLRNPELPVGWTSLTVIVLLMTGAQLFAVGLVGEYLGRLFLKTNGSPTFVVREAINCEDDAAHSRESGGS